MYTCMYVYIYIYIYCIQTCIYVYIYVYSADVARRRDAATGRGVALRSEVNTRPARDYIMRYYHKYT